MNPFRSLLALVIAGVASGCAASSEGLGQDDSALTAPAPSRWYLGTFEGSCTRSWGPAEERTLEILIQDGDLVVREPQPVTQDGAVLAIDTTILRVPVAADGTFYEEQLEPRYPLYRQETKGACDAARCEILAETKVGGEWVEGGSFTLTRTADGLVWRSSHTSSDYDLENGPMPGSKPYTDTETCQLRRTR